MIGKGALPKSKAPDNPLSAKEGICIKAFAVCSSSRKGWNTETLLKEFINGITTVDPTAECKLINLYDLDYKGCRGCGACKLKDGKFYGKCAVYDDITELLEYLSNADIIVFGSPIYYAGVTGELRSFMERLLYPYTAFKKGSSRSIAPKSIRTAFIYTMNVTEEAYEKVGYRSLLIPLENTVKRTFGYEPEFLNSYFTCQYSDYNKYVADLWDEKAKIEWHQKQFPNDCQSARALGRKIALSMKSEQKI